MTAIGTMPAGRIQASPLRASLVAVGALVVGAAAFLALSFGGDNGHPTDACRADTDAGTLAAGGCSPAQPPTEWNPAGALPAALFPAAAK